MVSPIQSPEINIKALNDFKLYHVSNREPSPEKTFREKNPFTATISAFSWIQMRRKIEERTQDVEVGTGKNHEIKWCKIVNALKVFLLKGTPWDLPRGPLVKTPHFHCRGHWVWSLVRELRPCMFHGMAKKFFLVINKRESSVENIGLGDLWAWERLRQGPASDTASDVPEDRPDII